MLCCFVCCFGWGLVSLLVLLLVLLVGFGLSYLVVKFSAFACCLLGIGLVVYWCVIAWCFVWICVLSVGG